MTTGTYTAEPTLNRGATERWVGTSAANTAQTISTSVSTSPPVVRRLLWVGVHYSASPTQTGVTVVLNSGAGSAYDVVLKTGTANAQDTFYEPTSEIRILPDDAIDVTAPAAGGVITSGVVICTEQL